MMNDLSNQRAEIETTCGSLLHELQKIWDEVGEPDVRRDEMLLEIEKECMAVYGRKVEKAKTFRAQLQQKIESFQAEIAAICSTLGEQPVNCDLKTGMSLKEKLNTIVPLLDDLSQRKAERKNQFTEVLNQLQEISEEISAEDKMLKLVDETDLSLKRLEKLHEQLTDLRSEKSNRLKLVEDLLGNLKSLCLVLGEDFGKRVHKIHSSLNNSQAAKDLSSKTIENLAGSVQYLQEVKVQRFQMLQDLATSLLELWCLMDTPIEEQQPFENVTSTITISEVDITVPNMLSLNNIDFVKGEVSRLQQLKSSKMKEIVLRKRLELEEVCRKMHMVTEEFEEYPPEVLESGSLDPQHVLEKMELQIASAKEEAFSRKEILEKMEKWFVARDEECWLEEYNRDDNRYNAGRGAHLTLKRAEKARAIVNKIPAMVDSLILKITAWEKERGVEFLYDGVRLLFILDEYSCLRKEKEQERQRQKDLKKLQGQLKAEEEARYGSKGSPLKSAKASKTLAGMTSNRKLSVGGAMLQNLKPQKVAPPVHSNKKADHLIRDSPMSCQQTAGFPAHSGRRNSEIVGSRPVNKYSSAAAKGRKDSSSSARKPLSPISLAMASKANIANFLEENKNVQSGTSVNNKTLLATPCKSTFPNNYENQTPKTMPIPIPSTPSTVTAPMLMAMTPATPCVPFGGTQAENIMEKVEYSFEEVRAGFICL